MNGFSVSMLDMQFRMLLTMGNIISRLFYGNRLCSAPGLFAPLEALAHQIQSFN
jgi:hypothetical protein